MPKLGTITTHVKEAQNANTLRVIAKKSLNNSSPINKQIEKEKVYQEHCTKAIDLELSVKETQAKSCFNLLFNLAQTRAGLGETFVDITNKKIVDGYINNNQFKEFIKAAELTTNLIYHSSCLRVMWFA
jgi:hypothetical protein